jgi:hypothetical protein
MSTPQQSFGRIVVDEVGITKRKRLFSNKTFQMAWEDLTAWAVSELILANQATGQERVLNQTLELDGANRLEIVQASETGGRFNALLEYLRHQCPEKEKQSVLAMYKSLGQGGPNALNAILAPYDGVIRKELERARHEFPDPTATEYAEIFKRLSQKVSETNNLSSRHARQIVFWYCEKHAPDISQALQKSKASL